MRRVNALLAERITASVGTMWTAYVFAVIGIMGIAGALTNNVGLVLIIGAVSGYFLQLVLLPVIMVGQNLQGAGTDATIRETHEQVTHLLDQVTEILADVRDDHTALRTVVADLHGMVTEIHGQITAP